MNRIMRKPLFYICENKGADQLRGNHTADQHLCFTTYIAQSLYFLSTKFQASSHLLWLCSPETLKTGFFLDKAQFNVDIAQEFGPGSWIVYHSAVDLSIGYLFTITLTLTASDQI